MARILIIEPDSILAEQYHQTLAQAGHDISVATGASSGLDALESPHDMIVMELQLGQHNGLEFLYEIRSYSDLVDVPVVLLTNVASSQIVHAQSYQLLGIRECLYKPETRLAKLQSVVNEIIEELGDEKS